MLYRFYYKYMTLKQIFGSNLHLYRKLRQLSQEQLAEKLEVSVKHLSTMETGKVFASAELLEKISKELNVSVSALFYTPAEKSLDDSDLAQIDSIVDEELTASISLIKNKIRKMRNR